MTSPDLDADPLNEQTLARWLSTKLPPGTVVSVEALERGSLGSSAESLFFDLQRQDAATLSRQSLVLKRSPPGPKLFKRDDLQRQHDLMNALHARGLPVPPSLWIELDSSLLGGQFLVMPRMPGQAISDRPPGVHAKGLLFDADPAQRSATWTSCLALLARLHDVDCRHSDFAGLGDIHQTPRQALLQQLNFLEDLLSWCETEQPRVGDLHLALEWLRAHCPAPARLAVCWGDAKVGNILFHDGKLAAALDWELAYLGPPESDLAYWMLVDETGHQINKVPRLEGVPGRAGSIALYEQLSGRKVEDIEYHLTYQALRLSVFLALVARLDAHTGAFGGRCKADDNPMIRVLRERLTLV